MTTFNIAANTVPLELRNLYASCAKEGGDKANIDTEFEYKMFCREAIYEVEDFKSISWEDMGLELKRIKNEEPEIVSDGKFVATTTGATTAVGMLVGGCMAGLGGAIGIGVVGLALGLVSSLLSLPGKHHIEDVQMFDSLYSFNPADYQLIKKTDEEVK